MFEVVRSSLYRIGLFVVFSLCAFIALQPQVANAAPETKRQYIVYGEPVQATARSASSTSTISRSAFVGALTRVNGALKLRGLKPKKTLSSIGAQVVSLTDSEANTLSDSLSSEGLHLELDQPVHAFVTPNDSYYATYQADMAAINLPSAWATTTGSSSIVVAVLDTGIAYGHSDIAANMWHNTGETPGNNIDDDGNGYVDDYYGYDFASNDSNPADGHFHGTHVAGTIGAVSNNGAGVAGVNWNVKLMALKGLGDDGSGSTSDLIEAVQYATAMKQRGVNIRVINASLGGSGSSASFQTAITQAYNAGILFIAAAGNDGANNNTTPSYPANYSNVISVAATDNNGTLASFSNYGSTTVHLAAPGVDILSVYYTGGYAFASGTSMAAPHVAGVAALTLSSNPTFSAAELKSRLINSVTAKASLAGKTITGGMINAAAAVVPAVTYSLSGTITVGSSGLSGVTVYGGGLGNQTTDSNGNYTFSGISSGTAYVLTPAKAGYTFSPVSATGTLSSNTTANFAATLLTYTVSGSVLVDGVGLAGVSIASSQLGSTATNGSGQFSYSNVPYGTSYTVTPTMSGYDVAPSSRSGTVTEATSLSFAAATPGTTYALEGQILVGGVGLSGVVLTDAGLGSVTTDSDGNFSFGEVAFGTTYSLTATLSGYTVDSTHLDGLILEDTSLSIEASKNLARSTLKGRITYYKHGRLKGVKATSNLGVANSNSRGEITFQNVSEDDEFVITLSKKGYVFYPRKITGVMGASNVTFNVTAYKQGSGAAKKAAKSRSKELNLSASH